MIQTSEGIVWRVPATHHWRNSWEICAKLGIHQVEEAVVVLLHREAVVNLWEFTVFGRQDTEWRKIHVTGMGIKGVSHQLCLDRFGVWCVPFGVWPPEEHILVC